MKSELTSGEKLLSEVMVYSNAGAGVIHVRAKEIARAYKELRDGITHKGYECNTWNVVTGSHKMTVEDVEVTAIREGDSNPDFQGHIINLFMQTGGEENEPKDQTFHIYVNADRWFEEPATEYVLQQLARDLPATLHRIIFITADNPLPESVSDLMVSVEMTTPTYKEIQASYTTLVGELDDSYLSTLKVSEDGVERICKAGSGLTFEEFETYLSEAFVRSMVDIKERDVTHDDLLTYINKSKTFIVNKSDLLELYPAESMDNVGGLDNVKEWVAKRKGCFSEEAAELGIEAPKGILLTGVSGCLSGDTMIPIMRNHRTGHRKERLDSLFYRLNGMHAEGVKVGVVSSHKKLWDLSMPTNTLSNLEDKGYIGRNEIEGVIYSGVKGVHRITTDLGYIIKATKDHKFLTKDGYTPLADLKVNQEVYMYKHGSLIDSRVTGRNKAIALLQINNVGNHPNARTRIANNLTYTSHPLHRLVKEASINRLPLEDFLYALHGDVSSLTFIDADLEVHHKDGNRLNNTVSNLDVLTKADHARLHMSTSIATRYTNSPRMQRIINIEYVGREHTYDIQMKDPNNNFIANGFVVHNSGKSLVAKSVANVLGTGLVKLDFGKMFNSFVGKSEERIRKALKLAETLAPCTILIEEIEKGLGSGSTGGDAGTSKRVLATFLTWMQDCTKPVFVVASANDVTQLPPELTRKGRLDQIFFVGLPTATEKCEILKIHLKKRGYGDTFTDEEIESLVGSFDGFVGAEIEAVVKEALIEMFSNGDKALKVIDIVKASKTIVPLSKSHAKVVADIIAWGSVNAIPASKPEGDKPKRKTRRTRNVSSIH